MEAGVLDVVLEVGCKVMDPGHAKCWHFAHCMEMCRGGLDMMEGYNFVAWLDRVGMHSI